MFFVLRFWQLTFPLCLYFSIVSIISAVEKTPDDVRYMLEDMYGADRQKWPAITYKKDLNIDGFDDWIVQTKRCDSIKECPAEIFICIPDKTGACSEYCYIEVKNLMTIGKDIKQMKCESSC